MSDRPCVLVFSGADPSGGAGMAADIQAITAMGAHALPVLTAITVQDNNRVHAVMPVAADVVLQQARALLAQVPVAAVKIGIPGSAENAQAIATLIGELRATHRAAAGARRAGHSGCTAIRRWCWTRCCAAAKAMRWAATMRCRRWRPCCRWPR